MAKSIIRKKTTALSTPTPTQLTSVQKTKQDGSNIHSDSLGYKTIPNTAEDYKNKKYFWNLILSTVTSTLIFILYVTIFHKDAAIFTIQNILRGDFYTTLISILVSSSLLTILASLYQINKYRNTHETDDIFQKIDSTRQKSTEIRESSIEESFDEQLEKMMEVDNKDSYIELLIKKIQHQEYEIKSYKDKKEQKTNRVKDSYALFITISETISEQIRHFDSKATAMLSTGTRFAKQGIWVFLALIFIWQIYLYFASYTDTHHYIGMASCSVIFIFMESLAAWCLKQHRAYVDASLYLVKIRSIFERKMQAYLLLKEYSKGEEGYQKTLSNFLEDINWPPEPHTAKADLSFVKEAMSTVSEFTAILNSSRSSSNSKPPTDNDRSSQHRTQ